LIHRAHVGPPLGAASPWPRYIQDSHTPER
jgi:hypothetical protein